MAKKQKPEWIVLKSGARRNGNWFASQYPTGWYFIQSSTTASYKVGKEKVEHKQLGPFKSFEDGLKKLKEK